MASEPQALAICPESPDEDDYRTLCAALAASVRGRAFLSEYARRNRNADTEILLNAVNRLGMHAHADAEAVAEMRAVLASVLRLLEARVDAPAERSASEAVPNAAPARLTAVPSQQEQEIPAPPPLAEPPAMVVAPPQPMPVSAAIMPDVNVLDAAVAAAAAAPAKPASARPETPSGERLRLLAPIMALDDDERLALFT